MTTQEKPVQHTQEPVTVRLLFNFFVVLKFIFLVELLFHFTTFIYTTVFDPFYFNLHLHLSGMSALNAVLHLHLLVPPTKHLGGNRKLNFLIAGVW